MLIKLNLDKIRNDIEHYNRNLAGMEEFYSAKLLVEIARLLVNISEQLDVIVKRIEDEP